ncbi:hypothetical protein V8J88_23755 [Massilia sp. W12]|uniref:hypothetical protein n=1 Tax=Massilia sp. W12 TaxID=3126507 RepID=UPI0030D12B39
MKRLTLDAMRRAYAIPLDGGLGECAIIIVAAAWMLGLRGLFALNPAWSPLAMSCGFLVLSPLALGFVHVTLAWRRRPHTWRYALLAPLLPMLLTLMLSACFGLEGPLCLTFVTPLLLLFASAGGALSWIWHRRRDAHATRCYIVLLPPLLAMALLPPVRTVQELHVTHEFAATPEQLWRQLIEPGQIAVHESGPGLIWRIGAPRPLSTVLLARSDHQAHGIGSVRRNAWQRGVSFDEVVDSWRPGQEIGWTYRFYPSSFPRGSMDLHAAPNSRSMQFLHTRYRIFPLDGGRVRLEMRLRYRLESGVNWYVRPLSNWLLADGAQELLGLFERRVQQAAARK